MDKYEYRAKTEQMLAYAEQKSYQKAMSIADTIDWRKVKNTAMLSTVSEIYENAGELGKARDTLFIAYDKAPSSRKVVYRLGIISLKLGHFDEAADCYEEFVKLAPKDPNQYILRYKILKAQKAPVKEQIEALEDFKHSEYVEKWAYELARLYAEAGMTSECLDECDDLILWFSEGTYVYQAMELKMKYKPLTPLQQEKYDHRNDGIGRKDSSKRKPSFRKSKERPAPNPRIADKVRKDVHVTDSIDLPDLPEPMARTHASEPEAESQPKTRIRSTSDISTTISGASLSDALKAGVAVASGAVAPESASDDSQMTGKMKIEEILANWEATQRENAKILEKSQEEAEKEKALREKKKEEEEEVLGATKPILSDDIRKLMEQLENGEEPEITDEDAEDFVDDEEDEATESPEDSSKEASDTDEEEPEENDFEEIVDSEEDDESDAVYDEEAEYEDEDDSEYDDDEEYEDYRQYVVKFFCFLVHIRVLLHKFIFAYQTGNLIGDQQQGNADCRLEYTDCGTKTVVAVSDTSLIREPGKYHRVILNQRVTKKHLTLHTYVQGATDAHNQQYDDGRSDTRQSDMPDLLQTACTVHISGLVKTRINTCHGGQINNCVPANLFPAVDQDNGYPDKR